MFVPCRKGQESREAWSFLQIRCWWKLMYGEGCVQTSESSQGTCKAENCKTESQLSSFSSFLLLHSRDIPAGPEARCFSDLISSRSQHMSVLDAYSLSSDRQRQCWMPILAPHLLCMTRGSPDQSLLQQYAMWSVAGSLKRKTMFSSTSIKEKKKRKKKVCLLHTWTPLFHVLWDEITKLFTLLLPHRAPASPLLQ